MHKKNDLPHDLLVTDKGLFSLPVFEPFISARAWDQIAYDAGNWVSQGEGSAYYERGKLLLKADEDIQKMCKVRMDTWQTGMHFGAYVAGKFVIGSRFEAHDGLNTPNSEHWGCEHAQAILKHRNILTDEAKTRDVRIDWDVILRAVTQCRKMDKKLWLVRTPDLIGEIGQGVSYAIYSCVERGYVNSRATPGPLAGAQFFESTQAALKVASGRSGVDDYVIVQVQASVEKITDFSHAKSSFAPLQSAIALADRKSMMAEMEKLDVAQLRERMQDMEKLLEQKGVDLAAGRVSDKPRKM